jgi:WD40 repeat protein
MEQYQEIRAMTIKTKNRTVLGRAIGVLAVSISAGLAGGQVVNEDFKLVADDGATNDNFGSVLAIDSGMIAVGAQSNFGNSGSGAAYVLDASTGLQIAKLIPNDGAPNDTFGKAIAISNGIVAVGSPADDDNGDASGSAYVFDAVTGLQIAKLLASDGVAFDFFGQSIAIGGGVVAVGVPQDDDNGDASGSVYLFDATTGVQITKLVPGDGTPGDNFGNAVAIGDGVVAVGAQRDDANGPFSGSAYLFDISTGNLLFKISPDGSPDFIWFGNSIAIADGVVAVGAWQSADNGGASGAAYLFDASTGSQITKLLPDDGAQGDVFGFSIDVDSGIVAVGAYLANDNGEDSGSAYVFDAATGVQLAKLLPSDGVGSDWFGTSIGTADGLVVAGAPLDNSQAGSAYLFSPLCIDSCQADMTADCVLDFFDVAAFLDLFASQDPAADFTADGVFDFFDVMAFLDAFSAGCP